MLRFKLTKHAKFGEIKFQKIKYINWCCKTKILSFNLFNYRIFVGGIIKIIILFVFNYGYILLRNQFSEIIIR